jgi:hypothetical protein
VQHRLCPGDELGGLADRQAHDVMKIVVGNGWAKAVRSGHLAHFIEYPHLADD